MLGIVCLLPLLASAWDTDGHMIVGLIAGELLSERAEKFIKNTIPTNAQDIPRSIAYASIWADTEAAQKYKWSKNLHFASTEFRVCSLYDEARDCPNARCVVTALANYTMRATKVGLPAAEREEAVKFLIHFVAEIHQPMHIGFPQDVGGNFIKIPNRATTLHNVWDKTLMEVLLASQAAQRKQKMWNYYDLAQEMTKAVRSAGANKELKSFVTEADLSSDQNLRKLFAQLASETTSHVTCKLAYRHLNGDWIDTYDDLDDDWFNSRIPAMLTQLKKAGVRLANLLDVIAAKYFDAVDKERAAKYAKMNNKQGPAKTVQVVPKYSNFFDALEVLSDDADNVLIGTLTDEQILAAERALPAVEALQPAKKPVKKPTKSLDKMSDAEFDQLLKDLKKRETGGESGKARKLIKTANSAPKGIVEN